MSRTMLGWALKDLGRTAAQYGAGMVVYAAMILALFPIVHRNTAAIDQYIKTFPEALLRAFGIADIGTLAGFVGAEYLGLIWPIIMAIFAIMAGASLVAQEIERGTAELWLSVPESRARLLAGKLGALLIALFGLVVVTIVTIGIGAALLGESNGFGDLLVLGVVLLAFGVAVAGYAALLSSLSDERGRPAGIAAGITFGFYLLWILSGISGGLNWLKYLSIFTAFTPRQALAGDAVPALGLLVLFLIGLACVVGALVIFERRDVVA